MPNGYELDMFRDIKLMREALLSIADSLEKIVTPSIPIALDPDVHWRLYDNRNYGDED